MLDLGLTPQISRERWRLDVYGAVEHPIFWDFAAFTAQPQVKSVSDIHCVTTWSRYDNQWEGLVDPRSPQCLPAARSRPATSCCIPMTATPPISRWRILPPKTPCSRIAGRACRWSRNMAARCGWWCRICISGKARNGCRASNSSIAGCAGLLGGSRLSQPRRSVDRAALFRRLTPLPGFVFTSPSGELKKHSKENARADRTLSIPGLRRPAIGRRAGHAGRRDPRLRAVRALLHLRQGRAGGQADRGGAGGQRHRGAAVRLHRSRLQRR